MSHLYAKWTGILCLQRSRFGMRPNQKHSTSPRLTSPQPGTANRAENNTTAHTHKVLGSQFEKFILAIFDFSKATLEDRTTTQWMASLLGDKCLADEKAAKATESFNRSAWNGPPLDSCCCWRERHWLTLTPLPISGHRARNLLPISVKWQKS